MSGYAAPTSNGEISPQECRFAVWPAHKRIQQTNGTKLKAAIALHFAFYNFCQTHKTIRFALAMEAGIANHGWSLAN
jgi:hypothetical protein